jgi:phosphoglycolate phosphatase/AHBA synthesis associated protein
MPEREPRALLFDLDGVLIDSREVWFELMNAAAQAFGAAPIDREAFAALFGQGLVEDARRFGRSVAEVEAFFTAHFGDHLARLRVEAAAQGVLAQLRRRGLREAVITNTPTPLARQLLAAAGLRAEVLVGGTDVPAAKPAPDMVWRACALLGVEPARAWVVGDSRYDREAARAAGARFVGLRIDGDLRVESLEQLLDLLTAAGAPRAAAGSR